MARQPRTERRCDKCGKPALVRPGRTRCYQPTDRPGRVCYGRLVPVAEATRLDLRARCMQLVDEAIANLAEDAADGGQTADAAPTPLAVFEEIVDTLNNR